jgi:fructose-specific phosphotransferase system IIC component
MSFERSEKMTEIAENTPVFHFFRTPLAIPRALCLGSFTPIQGNSPAAMAAFAPYGAALIITEAARPYQAQKPTIVITPVIIPGLIRCAIRKGRHVAPKTAEVASFEPE